VSPEIGIRLFGRDYQEILIRKPLRRLEVDLLLLEAFRSGIAWVRVVVEVPEIDDVYSQGVKGWNPAGLIVKGLAIAEHLVEVE